MALSSEDAAWLSQLKAARQRIMLGEQLVSVSAGGRSASFTPASLQSIENEIERLEAADRGASERRRGALGFRY